MGLGVVVDDLIFDDEPSLSPHFQLISSDPSHHEHLEEYLRWLQHPWEENIGELGLPSIPFGHHQSGHEPLPLADLSLRVLQPYKCSAVGAIYPSILESFLHRSPTILGPF